MHRFFLLAALLLPAAALANPRFDYVQNSALSSAPLSSDFAQGDAKAPVVMIEYASLSCPHCGHFANEVLPELKKRYIDTGKMLYILRPYPLNEPALKAADLVDCVAEKEGAERYYQFANVLFQTQGKWAYDATWSASLASIARVGGVSADMYAKCTSDTARETKVLKVKQQATELGVDHTPYIFINSHRYDDDPTLPKLTAYIDKLLAGAQKANGK